MKADFITAIKNKSLLCNIWNPIRVQRCLYTERNVNQQTCRSQQSCHPSMATAAACLLSVTSLLSSFIH